MKKIVESVLFGLVEIVLMASLLAGCGTAPEHSSKEGWSKISPEQLDTQGKSRYERAERARKDLARTLFGRLSEAMSEGGPATAIEVCNLEAQGITDRVGLKHDVRIGRTSHRLRNPNNTPPDWARQFDLVEKQEDEQVVLKHEEDHVAVLTPIHLKQKCAACHGPEETLNEGVKQVLTERYPNDEAMGFKPGELRGWFWVEVSTNES